MTLQSAVDSADFIRIVWKVESIWNNAQVLSWIFQNRAMYNFFIQTNKNRKPQIQYVSLDKEIIENR